MSTDSVPIRAKKVQNWIPDEIGERPENLDQKNTHYKLMVNLRESEIFMGVENHSEGEKNQTIHLTGNQEEFSEEVFSSENIEDIRGWDMTEKSSKKEFENKNTGTRQMVPDYHWKAVLEPNNYLGERHLVNIDENNIVYAEIYTGGYSAFIFSEVYPVDHEIWENF